MAGGERKSVSAGPGSSLDFGAHRTLYPLAVETEPVPGTMMCKPKNVRISSYFQTSCLSLVSPGLKQPTGSLT